MKTEIIIACGFCPAEIKWIRSSNPFKVCRLPEGWTRLTSLLGGHFVCPKCNDLMDQTYEKISEENPCISE